MSVSRSAPARPPWAQLRLLGGGLVLLAVLWRLGTGPVLAGIHRINIGLILAAFGITLVTTVCSARRWQRIAAALGLRLSLTDAVLAYYRSQFVNTVLPGGVLGDVHRAVDHGERSGTVGLAARAVAWERGIGQLVQAVLTAVVLLAVGWPGRRPTVLGLAAVGLGLAILFLTVRGRWRQVVRHDLRAVARCWPTVTVTSVVVVAGHAGVLYLAARGVGVQLGVTRLIALCLLVLLATSIPLNVAGWGPREGASAWLFGLAGSGSAAGLSAATVDGVLVLLACLPGAIVLIASGRRTASAPMITAGAHG